MTQQLLSELIRIRVTPVQYQQLLEASAVAGLKLSEYVRRLLVSAASLQQELAWLRESAEMLERSAQSEAAIMETLLLLRTVATSGQLDQVQHTLMARGLTPIKLEPRL